MAISFPSSPNNGDTYVYNGVTYIYDSTDGKWTVTSTSTANVNLAAVETHIVPASNVTYDLGTSDKSFRDLYLSGNTIHLGGATITSDGSAVTLPVGSKIDDGVGGTVVAATTTYVDTAIAGIVDTAPEALNTLNELASALDDDANFASNITNQITNITNQINAIQAGASVVADADSLPTSPSAGDITFISADGRLGVYSGTEWRFVQTSAPVVDASELWRIYANDGSNYGLWDIHQANGLYDGNGTRLADSLSFRGSGTLTSGEYSIIRGASDPFTDSVASGISWDSGPAAMFNGSRSSWYMNVGDYIILYLSSPLTFADLSGGSLNLRTFSGGRSDRCPRQMLLQYYTGTIGSNYDDSKWETYATLNSGQTNGNPTWSNITQDSVISV